MELPSTAGELSKLVGLPAWGAGLAADMLTIQFGRRVGTLSPLGRERETGDFALHLQGRWHVACAGSILLDSEVSASLSRGAKRNRLCELLRGTFASSPIVTAVSDVVDGKFVLWLDGAICIVSSPDPTDQGECWRMFRPSGAYPHFVVMGDGRVENS